MNQQIRFCEDCDNKLYHLIENNSLVYFCRVCGKKDVTLSTSSHCVLSIQMDGNDTSDLYEHLIHKYTKHDPTLPHIFIPCPNESCVSNVSKEGSSTESFKDAVYIRYDNQHMKHLYLCTKCDFKWKGK